MSFKLVPRVFPLEIERCALSTRLGSLSNDDGDGNKNGKKAIGFRIGKQQLCTCITLFLYISLQSLHDYDVKMPIFTFSATPDKGFLFLFLIFDTVF